MSCFDVKILDPNINTIEIETCIGDQPSSIDIISYNNTSLIEVNHCIGSQSAIQDIVGGSGITVNNISGIYTISSTDSDNINLLETVQDIIGNSGLLAGNYTNINYNDSTGYTTVSVTGLQPSGNYSIVGHSHTISDVSGLQTVLDGLNEVIEVADYETLLSTAGASGTIYITLDTNKMYRYISPIIAQLGNKILGEAPDDLSGYNLDLNSDGTILAIGAVNNDGNGNNSGHVRVYNWNGTSWIQLGNDIDGEAVGDASGIGISLNDAGNILAIGANLNDGNGTNSGHVRVYSWNGISWIQLGNDIDGETVFDLSGEHIKLNGNGNILAIGAKFNDGNGDASGHVRVYNWNGTSWTQLGNDIDGRAAGNQSGAIGLNSDGNILAVGEPFDDSSTTNGGIVKVYLWDGSSWIQRGSTIYGQFIEEYNGISVSLNGDGNIIAVGATFGAFSANSGYVRIYEWDGSDWIQKGNNISGEASGDNFGTIVKINKEGNIIAVTAPYNDDNGLSSGQVRIYVWGGNNWIQFGNDIDGESANQFIGIGIALNDTGNILAVGARRDDTNGALSGSTRVYNISIPIELVASPSAHNHVSADITDFNTSVSGLLPVKNIFAGGGIGITNSSGDYTVSVTGTFGLTSEEVDDRVSNLLVAGSYINLNYNDLANTLTVSATGLQPSGNYSTVGHTHLSSEITDFNSSVSGLIPVKDIVAGSGISISSSSGIYTIDANISGVILEAIQDNLGSGFLVAGTGVKLTYNDPANTLRLDNLHTEINELSLEPQGFVNRLDSVISFNDSTRTFTIAPSGSSYDIYIEGVKVTKKNSESIVIPTGTALNYLHFDTDTGLLSNKNTVFNFDTDVPIAYIHWNSDINQSTFFGEERHGIRMDSSTHKWIHNTFGMQYISGLSIGGYVLLGNGSSNSHAQIDISDGTLYQEDIIISIADGDNGVEFTQQLSPIAYIPVYYHLGSTGQWVRDVSTPYPLKYNATRALYNLYSGGTWTTPNVPNNRYFAMWIVATNDINDPILAIIGQREDSSLGSAENNNIWSDVNLTNIPTNEIRPLYRLIFVTNDTFTNTPKSSLQSILDLRKSIITATYGVSQNDHGNLFGLGDDDHFQYIHINEPRTITANHTFTNGLTINNGLLNATSGSFTSLTVNGTGVSLNGHTHTSSSITDFNTSVSGLLPTIANSGDNRILTSDGTSTGIVAESGLLFNGEQLVIRPNIGGSVSGLSPLVLYNDIGYSGLTNQGPQIILNSYASGNNISTSSAGRLIFSKFRGTEQSPLPANSGDCIFVIRGNTLDANNSSVGNIRIRADVVSPPVSGSQPYDSNRLYFNTSDGQSTTNNILSLEDDGQVYTNGYLTIFNQSRHSLVNNSSQQQSLGIYSQPSGNIGTSGSLRGSAINFSPVSPTGDYNINYYSTLSNIFSEVRENVTNSGSIVGAQFGAWRNSRGSNIPGWYDDNGTLTALYGLSSLYGHSIGQSGSLGPAPTGVTPYTESAYGIFIWPQRGYGTIEYAYDLYLAADNYTVGDINTHYGIYQESNNPNYFAGSISIDNGLSSPTPVYSLGTVSGNTAISYAIDRQIQTLTLNGSSVNFTEGTGWNLANKSVDVVLQITVTSTTTVAFDSGFVTDWYSILPTFSSGTYLILLRSVGSSVVQGHYIGKKLY
jgi:hypothetical protein